MISPDQYSSALRVLHRLIVHAKAEAEDVGQAKLAEFLNDLELLPDYLADDQDRTTEFAELLQGIAATHPSCRYIIEEFSRAPAARA